MMLTKITQEIYLKFTFGFFFFPVSPLAEPAPNCVLAHIISSLALKFVNPNEDPW